MSISLENRTHQMQVFNVPCDRHQRQKIDAECSCTEQIVTILDEDPRTGQRTPRTITKRTPRAITLLAKTVAADLPDSVLEIPEIKRALQLKQVRIVKTSSPALSPKAQATTKGKRDGKRTLNLNT